MKISCPRCKASQELDPGKLGVKWRCTECGQKIKVSPPKSPDPAPVKKEKNKPKPAPKSKPKVKAAPAPSASERRKSAAPDRPSARRRAARQQEWDEGEQPQAAAVSNDQAMYMIGGFVIVFIIFAGFLFMRGGNDDKPNRRRRSSVSTPVLSPIEEIQAAIKENPDDIDLRKRAARIILDETHKLPLIEEAYTHISMYLMEVEDDMEAYTIAVEAALRLEKRDSAELYREKAHELDPGHMAPILILFADDIRKQGLEKKQALTFEGIEAALLKVEEADRLFKQGQEENEKFHTAAEMYFEILDVLGPAQEKYPYNRWIERKMEHVNQNLMWARKMYRDLTDKDREMWADDEIVPEETIAEGAKGKVNK